MIPELVVLVCSANMDGMTFALRDGAVPSARSVTVGLDVSRSIPREGGGHTFRPHALSDEQLFSIASILTGRPEKEIAVKGLDIQMPKKATPWQYESVWKREGRSR